MLALLLVLLLALALALALALHALAELGELNLLFSSTDTGLLVFRMDKRSISLSMLC